MKKEIIINGDSFSDRLGFTLEIRRKFTKDIDWVDYNSADMLNLDAVNDFFTGGFNVTEHEEPVKIIWLNSEKSKKDLGKEETIYYFSDILKVCSPDNRNSVEEKINLLREGQGESLFEIIIDCIKSHKHIELSLQ